MIDNCNERRSNIKENDVKSNIEQYKIITGNNNNYFKIK